MDAHPVRSVGTQSVNGLDEWMAFFRDKLPEATEDECQDLAKAAEEYVHQGRMIIHQTMAEDAIRHQATADFLNSLPRGGD